MSSTNTTVLAVTSIPADLVWELSPYHYIPTQWVCILFLVLFGISGALHLAEAVLFRLWFLLPTAVLAACGELIGWSGRTWSTLNIPNDTPFLMQLSSTIISPTPLLAAIFVIFGRLTRRLGPQYSRLTPRMYTIIFCTSDVVALVLQAFGGGLASGNSESSQKLGTKIMLAGIGFQLAILSIFMLLVTEYFVRYHLDRPARAPVAAPPVSRSSDTLSPAPYDVQWTANGPRGLVDKRLKAMIGAMCFSTLCLFIRSIYRTVELSDGWNGRVIGTQVYFNVLDGTMVFLAMFTLNVFHPGFLLEAPRSSKASWAEKA
ncbi:RTA1-domain-containing protein [Gloeophyllum trabeum ATCC 11539]|uniref:RTA1-domain-containing protein n=1 Tax=Gloeophyllum trabeum (strain ATCC 11539 / FP-39264 / Madison 617) TaxID=670483 RepID=S7PXL1_GLOTA|nr:RTA1-domain-containing protein [Gloeophyllum trabeum ATCC 11539]EPQ52032.1 RTA1-domain-containing protein [Gloeophyllum trabeum ATCC 11539]